MTYSNCREELILTEGAKTRFIIKGLKKIKGIIKKPKTKIFPIGSTKASGRLSDVDPDLIAQFPGVNYRKLMYPDYKANRNPKLAKAIKYVKGKLERENNTITSPYSTYIPDTKSNVLSPIPPKLSKDIKANLSKGTKLTDDQKKKNFADYVKSLTKKVKDKNKVKKNLKTYEGGDKYYPPEIGESAIAIKAGSKLLPKLMVAAGLAGTIMQASKKGDDIRIRSGKFGTDLRGRARITSRKDESKTADIAREKGLDLTDPRQRRKAYSLANKRNKTNKTNKKVNPKTGDVVKPRYDTKLKGIRVDAKKGEAEASEKLVDKINNPTYLEKIRRIVRKEEVMAAPTNSTGPAVPGTGDDSSTVVVKKKKKTYAYGGKGSRKMWMNNK